MVHQDTFAPVLCSVKYFSSMSHCYGTSTKGGLMRSSVGHLVSALAVPAIAALGGAAVVFSEFDDAPGGILVGYLLIIGAVALSLRTAQHRTKTP